MERVELAIEGMHCASCVGRIERAVRAVAGVAEVNVSLAGERAAVTFDPRLASAGDLVKAIESAGYSAEPAAPASTGRMDEDLRRQRHEKTVAAWRNLFILGAILTVPIALLSMFSHNATWRPWVRLLLATPVQVLVGRPFYAGALRILRRGGTSMDTLIALGSTAAYAFSVVVFVSMVRTPARPLAGGDLYFDGAAMILSLIALGKWLEGRARGRASSAIRELLELAPPVAHRLDDAGAERDVPVAQVQVGDRLRVRPGEKIPIDGTVTDGASAVDESMLTGESIPADKTAGDELFAGTLNTQGSLVLAATRVGAETALSRIVELVRKAQDSKAAVQRLADRVSSYFVPAVIAVALLTLLGWGLLGGEQPWRHAVLQMTAVLIIACPCALGLATPAAIMVAVGRGATLGVLIRDAQALERAARIDAVILDKTGTVTRGRPELTDRVVFADAHTKDDLLRLAAAVEQPSEHPLGRAVVRAAADRKLSLPEARDFAAAAALGVGARVEGRLVRVGSADFVRENGPPKKGSGVVFAQPNKGDSPLFADDAKRGQSPAAAKCRELEEQGKTVLFVSAEGELIGLLAVADTVKPGAAEAVGRMKRMGLAVYLVTGDNERTARAVAEQVGIEPDRVLASVLPADKAEKVRSLQRAGRTVAMVGDGINDAPALAAADVGIAIGAGADVAVEAAAVTLVSGELIGAARAIRLARAGSRKIRQNLFWAFAYNAVGIPLAALAGLSPMIAAAAMAASSVSVVANSLLLRRTRLD